MSDIALVWDEDNGAADFAIEDNDLLQDDGLETALLLSLFTDRRAELGDALPDGETDRRGWWADELSENAGDLFGSRLWLLSRSKETEDTRTRAEEYAREATEWLIEDRVCDLIEVSASFPEPQMISLIVVVHRPGRSPTEYRFNHAWSAQEARI